MSKIVQEVNLNVVGNYYRNVYRRFYWSELDVSILLQQKLNVKKPTH